MALQAGKNSSKYPLRLMASLRKNAEVVAAQEGVSLNQFINVAVAEKLAQLQHQAWIENRPRATQATVARALSILDRAGAPKPEKGDELPPSYRTIKLRSPGKKRTA